MKLAVTYAGGDIFQHFGKTEEFKKRLADGQTLDDIMPEAYAVVREAGKRVLENLLEAEELKDADVNRRVKSQTALVRSDSAVELDTISEVGLYLAGIVHPRHAEGEDTVGLDHPLHNLGLLELRMLVIHILN